MMLEYLLLFNLLFNQVISLFRLLALFEKTLFLVLFLDDSSELILALGFSFISARLNPIHLSLVGGISRLSHTPGDFPQVYPANSTVAVCFTYCCSNKIDVIDVLYKILFSCLTYKS